jgi:uncharacterized membrane protein AbrB (regulator of aidB expression)
MFLFAAIVWMSYIAWRFFLWSLAIMACGVLVALILAAYLSAETVSALRAWLPGGLGRLTEIGGAAPIAR